MILRMNCYVDPSSSFQFARDVQSIGAPSTGLCRPLAVVRRSFRRSRPGLEQLVSLGHLDAEEVAKLHLGRIVDDVLLPSLCISTETISGQETYIVHEAI